MEVKRCARGAAGAWPPGEPNDNLSTNQAATPNANSNLRRCGHSSEAEFEWRRTGAQGALPLEPRPAGGPGRGLASRRAWQGPWHRPAAKFRRGALFEACDEATDAPTDEQASGVAPDAERSEAIQNQGRRATGAREIAN